MHYSVYYNRDIGEGNKQESPLKDRYYNTTNRIYLRALQIGPVFVYQTSLENTVRLYIYIYIYIYI